MGRDLILGERRAPGTRCQEKEKKKEQCGTETYGTIHNDQPPRTIVGIFSVILAWRGEKGESCESLNPQLFLAEGVSPGIR
jgi:hypothetical protein